jgi:hypothetical protein
MTEPEPVRNRCCSNNGASWGWSRSTGPRRSTRSRRAWSPPCWSSSPPGQVTTALPPFWSRAPATAACARAGTSWPSTGHPRRRRRNGRLLGGRIPAELTHRTVPQALRRLHGRPGAGRRRGHLRARLPAHRHRTDADRDAGDHHRVRARRRRDPPAVTLTGGGGHPCRPHRRPPERRRCAVPGARRLLCPVRQPRGSRGGAGKRKRGSRRRTLCRSSAGPRRWRHSGTGSTPAIQRTTPRKLSGGCVPRAGRPRRPPTPSRRSRPPPSR